MRRCTVSRASLVCMDARTRWPVSAAVMAAWTVSVSRSSPMRMTSGSCRMAARSAPDQSRVSVPSSRWVTVATRSWCSTSIGSSRVRMWTARWRLMRSTIAGERRRLARPGRAGDEHEPPGAEGELADGLRHAHVLQRDRGVAHPPHDAGVGAPRPERVDAEPPHALDDQGVVGLEPRGVLGLGAAGHRRRHERGDRGGVQRARWWRPRDGRRPGPWRPNRVAGGGRRRPRSRPARAARAGSGGASAWPWWGT